MAPAQSTYAAKPEAEPQDYGYVTGCTMMAKEESTGNEFADEGYVTGCTMMAKEDPAEQLVDAGYVTGCEIM